MHANVTGDAATVLTPGQKEILEGICARLIPSDEVGPGAMEAGVVDYIDRALASDHAVHRSAYADGLTAVDECAQRRHGSTFAALGPAEQDAILADFEGGTAGSGHPDESAFFELVRTHAFEGMFGDPGWGGNRDFVGWELLGYAGPHFVWEENEQQLDAAPDSRDRATADSELPTPPRTE